jgi:predicted RNA binding protein YcfA (HicA-like mRNA interferase family)
VSPKRLRVVSGARVVRALEKNGLRSSVLEGSHCKLRRGSRTVIVPLHDEVRPGTLASILRELL